MPCFSPLTAFQAPFPAAFGPRPKLRFKYEPGWKQIEVPCGGCIGCRLDKSRTWAARCMHEAHMHTSNLFLTLTYDDHHLPTGSEGRTTLVKRDLQLFWKRLRKAGYDVRYYSVGEYGDNTGRPHYHAVAFGLALPDLVLYTRSNGFNLYTSQILDSVWKNGRCWIGDVTFESCAYVARYVMKKLTGNHAKLYEHEGILPEFALMSRRPGIGSDFYDRYRSDLLPHDNTIIRGNVKISTPRYYLNKYSLSHPTQTLQIKSRRQTKLLSFADENTPQRRTSKQEAKLHKLQKLLRSFE